MDKIEKEFAFESKTGIVTIKVSWEEKYQDLITVAGMREKQKEANYYITLVGKLVKKWSREWKRK